MAASQYGKIIRKARINAGITLTQMAQALSVSPAFLSSMETGKKNISISWLNRTKAFFKETHGLTVQGVECAADLSNQTVDLSGLTPAHGLVASLARVRNMTSEIEQEFQKLLTSIERT